MTTEQKKIWSAGFLDGEGTITIKRCLRNKKGRSYIPYMACSQVNKNENSRETIELLKNVFGGSIYEYTPKNNRINVCQWTATSKNAIKILKEIMPYLIGKKKQAILLIEFYNKCILKKKNYRLSSDEIADRENYFYKMRELNVKGKLQLQRLNERTAK